MTIKRWQRTMRRWGTRSLGFGAAMTLVACTTPISYPELRQTAAVTGCWPMGYATPNPVTATPQSTTLPSLARPTTTSVPRCTPIPGAPTLAPYPTTVPTLVPYPTQQPIVVNGGNDLTTALELPRLQHVDVAVHPSEGWAAVASVWPDTAGSRHIFVRVFNPQARAWGTARQVNPPPAEKGVGCTAASRLVSRATARSMSPGVVATPKDSPSGMPAAQTMARPGAVPSRSAMAVTVSNRSRRRCATMCSCWLPAHRVVVQMPIPACSSSVQMARGCRSCASVFKANRVRSSSAATATDARAIILAVDIDRSGCCFPDREATGWRRRLGNASVYASATARPLRSQRQLLPAAWPCLPTPEWR